MLKQKMKRFGTRAGVVVSGLALTPVAMAQESGIDFSSLTESIDLGSVITAVMAVGAVLVGVYVAVRGARIVLQMVRGG